MANARAKPKGSAAQPKREPGAKSSDTRDAIVRAALEAFSTYGFDGASTRQIAALAGENQGLITYHFSSKENLWKAAVDSVFVDLKRELGERAAVLVDADVRTRLRLWIIFLVRYAARRPEHMRLMVQEGKADSPRMKWLVETHIKWPFEMVAPTIREAIEEGIIPDAPIVHYFYSIVGASSLFFSSAPEVHHLTGDDPFDPETIDAHAETVVNLVLR
jgi:AcrR family transcriptional regulator